MIGINGLFDLGFLFDPLNLQNILIWFILLGVIPYAIAYFAYKKGYSFWVFFLVTYISFFATLLIAIYLPKREKQEVAIPDKTAPGDETKPSEGY